MLDELIELHKSSIQINRDADAALARAVEDSLETLRRQHEEFALVKRAFQEDLLRDLELAAKRAQSFLGKLMTGLDAGVQTFLTRVTSATRSFEADVIGLRAVRHALIVLVSSLVILTSDRISTL